MGRLHILPQIEEKEECEIVIFINFCINQINDLKSDL